MDRSKVVTLCTFPASGEAMIYKTLLESNGIECELINDTEVLPLQSDLFKVTLVVNEKDLDRAREILNAKFDEVEFDTETHSL